MFEINKVIFEYISEPFHNPACSSLFENILSESTLGLGMKGFIVRAVLLLLRTSPLAKHCLHYHQDQYLDIFHVFNC